MSTTYASTGVQGFKSMIHFKERVTRRSENKVGRKMTPCLCVLSVLLRIATTADILAVEVETNITQIRGGENFFIRCIVYGIPSLYFLDPSNSSVEWIIQKNNRITILGQFPKRTFFQTNYEIDPAEWNTVVHRTSQNAINFTIVINEVTQRERGIYTCVVSMGSEVVRRKIDLSDDNATTSISFVYVDYAVSREEADNRCSLYGLKSPNNKTAKHDLSSIMESNETTWTFNVDDRYVIVEHRRWLSIRGCYHINVTKNAKLYQNCDLIVYPHSNMMNSFIGIHNNSCYILPNNSKDIAIKQLPESVCNWRCKDVIETSCGGTDAVSLFKVIDVSYIDFGGFQASDEEECNALYIADVELPYQRIACQNTSACSTLCVQNINKNTDEITSVNKYRDSSSTEWMNAWESCAEHNASLLDERGNMTLRNDEFPCIGVIQSSQLLFKERTLGILRKNENGEIHLESAREREKKFPFICEILNMPAVQTTDSGGTQASNKSQMTHDSFDVLIIVIPTSICGLVILLTVIICVIKRRKKEKMNSEEKEDDVTVNAALTNNVTVNAALANEDAEPEEDDVLRQRRQTTNDDALYDQAKERSVEYMTPRTGTGHYYVISRMVDNVYDVPIMDQSLSIT